MTFATREIPALSNYWMAAAIMGTLVAFVVCIVFVALATDKIEGERTHPAITPLVVVWATVAAFAFVAAIPIIAYHMAWADYYRSIR